MSNATRIPRKFLGFFVLFGMVNRLVLPIGVREKRVFAEGDQPLLLRAHFPQYYFRFVFRQAFTGFEFRKSQIFRLDYC